MSDPTASSREHVPPSAQTPDKSLSKKRLKTFIFCVGVFILYFGLCQLTALTAIVGKDLSFVFGILTLILGVVCLVCGIGVFLMFKRFLETIAPLFRSKVSYSLLLVLFALISIVLLGYSFQVDRSEKAKYEPVVNANITVSDPDPNAVVTCDGQPMDPTQVCDHILTYNGSSSTTTYTYDEQKKIQQDIRIEKAKTALLAKQYQQQVQEQSKHGVLNTPLGWIVTFVGAAFGLLVLIGLVMLRQVTSM